MKLICMGDSITFGLGLADPAMRWTDLTARCTGHRLINCGVSGDTTAGMLARCQRQVFGKEADAMLLLGGINDISILGEYRSVCANVISMVRQAQAEGLAVLLGVPLPIVPQVLVAPEWDPERDMGRIGALCEDYARWIQAYGRSNQIPVVDFRSAFFLPEGQPDGTLFLDGIHPNAAGHRIMADVLSQTLEEFFRSDRYDFRF